MSDNMITGPVSGWEKDTVYLVEVSFGDGNPIHSALFFSGYISNGKPMGYNELWNPGYARTFAIDDVKYLKVLSKVGAVFNEKTPNSGKLIPGDKKKVIEETPEVEDTGEVINNTPTILTPAPIKRRGRPKKNAES